MRVFGGAGEAAGFGDSAEVAELMKFHGGNSKLLTAARVAAGEFQTNECNRV